MSGHRDGTVALFDARQKRQEAGLFQETSSVCDIKAISGGGWDMNDSYFLTSTIDGQVRHFYTLIADQYVRLSKLEY